jgi:hypothetical protein
MTAPIHKPSRSEAEADVDGPSRSSFSDSAPAAEVRRLKPSRSEPEEELVAAVYAGDHAPELQKLQQLNSLGKEVTSRAYNHLRAPVPSIYCIFVMELFHFILFYQSGVWWRGELLLDGLYAQKERQLAKPESVILQGSESCNHKVVSACSA